MKNILTLLFVITFSHSFAQTGTVRSKTMVDPTAMFAGSFGGTIQATTFKEAKKIEVKAADTSASVTSYTIYF